MRTILAILMAFGPLLASGQQGPDSLWEPLPLRFQWGVGKLYPDPVTDDLYMTRFLGTVNGLHSILVKWDGTAATLIHNPLNQVFDMVRHNDKLLLIGDRWGEFGRTLVELEGQTWRTVDSFDDDYAPWTIYPLNGDVLVTGFFDNICGHPIREAAVWNGSSTWRDFHRMDTAFHDEVFVDAFQQYKGELFIGGRMQGPKWTRNIARFDGKNWMDVGNGIGGNGLSNVSSMLVWKDELYVAGQFLERDGARGNCIAKWDGQRWHRLGDGITQFGFEAAVYDMAVYHDQLYVVGVFGEAGGIPARNIAKWDGTRWCSLNTDFVQGTPVDLAVAKGELYMAGTFDTLNGKAFSHVARWMGGDYVKECSPVQLSVAASNETRDGVVFPNPVTTRLRLRSQNVQSLTIYDAAGKLVNRASDPELRSRVDVEKWTPGLYFGQAVYRDGTVSNFRFSKQ